MNKRIITLFIGFAIIAVVLILNSTVFTISGIDVTFDSRQSSDLQKVLSENIINASGIQLGKNVFTLSESSVIKNIHAKLPDVRILGIERRFPNKVIIHASRRFPVMAIPFKDENNKSMYAVVDSEMVVLTVTESIGKSDYTLVDGFTLTGDNKIAVGNGLTTKFGNEIYYLQNIAVSFEQAGLLPDEFVAFIKKIGFERNNTEAVIHTNSGVKIKLEDINSMSTKLINERVIKSYEWYNSFSETDKQLQSGYISFNNDQNKFVWYDI